jgi:hypothetical protein
MYNYLKEVTAGTVGGHKEITRLYRQGEKKVTYIAGEYSRCLQEMLAEGITDIGKYMVFDADNKMNDMRAVLSQVGEDAPQCVRNVLCINFALNNLDKDESFVLYNDFFFPKASKWWLGTFSRSVYYRTRKKAVLQFLKVCALWND